VWLNYYDDNTYSPAAIAEKSAIVDEYLGRLVPRRVWDLGANDGRFSRLAARRGAFTVAFDADAGTVEKSYRDCVDTNIEGLLPLVMDLTNPTPALGWAARERQSLIERGPVDTVMALALMHHLAVSNNVPLDSMAEFFGNLAHSAIVEYVPPDDRQVRRLLEHRGGGSATYTLDEFESAFGKRYRIVDRRHVGDTGRIIFLFSRS
jgi:ribosomal protein L11 methylase PrmA